MVVNSKYSPFPKEACNFFVQTVEDLADVPKCPCGSVVMVCSTGDMWVCFPGLWQKFGSDETIVKEW